jgi:hypothetical protein
MSSKRSQSPEPIETTQKPLSQQYAEVVRLRKAVAEAERIASFAIRHIPGKNASGRRLPARGRQRATSQYGVRPNSLSSQPTRHWGSLPLIVTSERTASEV